MNSGVSAAIVSYTLKKRVDVRFPALESHTDGVDRRVAERADRGGREVIDDGERADNLMQAGASVEFPGVFGDGVGLEMVDLECVG